MKRHSQDIIKYIAGSIAYWGFLALYVVHFLGGVYHDRVIPLSVSVCEFGVVLAIGIYLLYRNKESILAEIRAHKIKYVFLVFFYVFFSCYQVMRDIQYGGDVYRPVLFTLHALAFMMWVFEVGYLIDKYTMMRKHRMYAYIEVTLIIGIFFLCAMHSDITSTMCSRICSYFWDTGAEIARINLSAFLSSIAILTGFAILSRKL